MAYLTWSDKYSVNVKEIDEQHRQLIMMINTLHEALLAEKGRDVQKAIIHSMVDYAANHFGTEERYMQLYNYPGHRAHKSEHDKFTCKAIELKKRTEGAGFVLTIEVLGFLKSWLQDHILVTDMQYANHFNKCGLQ